MTQSQQALAIVEPMTLTDAMLIATDVPETDYAAYAGGTVYALGDRVILVSTHKIYQSLQAGNTGNPPATSDLWWVEVSATNRWKAFDTSNSSRTVATSTTISYTIRPGKSANGVSVLNVVNATSLRIRLIDPTYGTVYDETTSFAPLPVSPSWWNWFFGQRRIKTQHVAIDLPSFPNADLQIDFVGVSGLAVGVIMFGQIQFFGAGVKYGARSGIQSYTRKEPNEFGDIVVVPRAFSKRASFDLLIDIEEVDPLQNYLSSLTDKPCMYIIIKQLEAFGIFGFYKNFDILIAYEETADCTMEIEGLT